MEKTLVISDENVINKIYTVRGRKVMLDRDLAEMYGVETRRLNEQVRRNTDRFPKHFMFKLTEEEVKWMVSQNAIPSRQVLGGALPNVFTEHGVLMLANVLKSPKAVAVSIKIIDIFVRLREALLDNKDIVLKLEQLDKRLTYIGHDVKMHDGEIETIFELIREIMDEKLRSRPRNPIGFKTNATGK